MQKFTLRLFVFVVMVLGSFSEVKAQSDTLFIRSDEPTVRKPTNFFDVTQEPNIDRKNRYHARYVGFDANGLLSQVIPFNTIIETPNSPAIISRLMWGESGVRTALGAVYDFEDSELQTLYFSIGFANRKEFANKFYWLRGVDFKTYFENNAVNFFDNPDGFVGIAPYLGVEYTISPVVSVSTESSLDVGADLDGFFALQVRAPIQLQVHFNLYSK